MDICYLDFFEGQDYKEFPFIRHRNYYEAHKIIL